MDWLRIESRASVIAFVAAFLAVAAWESARPLRQLTSAAGYRWSRHAMFYVVSIGCVGLLIRVSPVFVALAVAHSHSGLLNHAVIPYWLKVVIAFLALDLCHYGSHRLCHAVEIFWRVHRVHHSDRDFDVSTAMRFHPVELVIRHSIYLGAIALLAPPVAAALAYGLLVAVENLFVHANQSLPPAGERILRRIMVTPDLHRIHHSEEIENQNLNFGEVFPWWDRLFGTYASQPAHGPVDIVVGLRECRGVDTLSVPHLLAARFRPLTSATSAAENQNRAAE